MVVSIQKFTFLTILSIVTLSLTLGNVSSYAWGQHHAWGQRHGHCCPTPCPPADAADEGEVPAPPEDEDPMDTPEMADLTDADLASAPQSAVPGVLGDSMSFGGCGVLTFPSGLGFGQISVCPSGGRKYKVTENTSPIPQHRVFYNYHYFDNAFAASDGGNTDSINVSRHEFGVEWPFWCNLASVQLTVPFSDTISSDIDATAGLPTNLTDTEFGNISVAVKGILYQDCCKTISAGLGIDLPTAEDVELLGNDGVNNTFFRFENEAVTLSPFVGWQVLPGCNTWLQGFAQVAIPLNENTLVFDDGGGNVVTAEFEELALLHLDVSGGVWLHRDCCGNGIAFISELHYTASLSDAEVINGPGGASFAQDNIDLLHATVGTAFVRGCWDVTPAFVFPLLDEPDRFFDWEFAVYVNRRF